MAHPPPNKEEIPFPFKQSDFRKSFIKDKILSRNLQTIQEQIKPFFKLCTVTGP